MAWQPVTPFVVRVVEEPSRETSVADILLGAVGFVGAVLLVAALVGVLAGAALILAKKWRERRGRIAPLDDGVGLRLNALDGSDRGDR